jgi:hypothetical protein
LNRIKVITHCALHIIWRTKKKEHPGCELSAFALVCDVMAARRDNMMGLLEFALGSSNLNSEAETPTRNASVSDLVIGIDFGTTFTGVAYAHSLTGNSDNPRDLSRGQARLDAIAEKVVLIRAWPMANMHNAEKTPTVLAYEGGAVTAWGGKVRSTHQTKIEYFKLGLQPDASEHYGSSDANSASPLGGFLDDHEWRHPDLPNKEAIDYAADFLREVREYVLHHVLPRQLGQEFLRNERISYAITVPAIWSYKARDMTKTAAERAGIAQDSLVIITEPEAAALYCATTLSEVNLKEGDRFLICDAGGGTVVISNSFQF